MSDYDRYSSEQLKKEHDKIKKQQEADRKYKIETKKKIEEQRLSQKREYNSLQNSKQFSNTSPISIKQTPTKSQAAKNSSTIKFSLPDGKSVIYEFNPLDTFEVVERKLKDNNHIEENALIEFQSLGIKVSRDQFGLQLKDKQIVGKVAIRVVVLAQPAEQEPSQE